MKIMITSNFMHGTPSHHLNAQCTAYDESAPFPDDTVDPGHGNNMYSYGGKAFRLAKPIKPNFNSVGSIVERTPPLPGTPQRIKWYEESCIP